MCQFLSFSFNYRYISCLTPLINALIRFLILLLSFFIYYSVEQKEQGKIHKNNKKRNICVIFFSPFGFLGVFADGFTRSICVVSRIFCPNKNT